MLEKTQLVGVPHADVVEANTTITVEYYRPGSENPGDVQSCTTLLVGAVEAGTFTVFSFNQCHAPLRAFRCVGFSCVGGCGHACLLIWTGL